MVTGRQGLPSNTQVMHFAKIFASKVASMNLSQEVSSYTLCIYVYLPKGRNIAAVNGVESFNLAGMQGGQKGAAWASRGVDCMTITWLYLLYTYIYICTFYSNFF